MSDRLIFDHTTHEAEFTDGYGYESGVSVYRSASGDSGRVLVSSLERVDGDGGEEWLRFSDNPLSSNPNDANQLHTSLHDAVNDAILADGGASIEGQLLTW